GADHRRGPGPRTGSRCGGAASPAAVPADRRYLVRPLPLALAGAGAGGRPRRPSAVNLGESGAYRLRVRAQLPDLPVLREPDPPRPLVDGAAAGAGAVADQRDGCGAHDPAGVIVVPDAPPGGGPAGRRAGRVASYAGKG